MRAGGERERVKRVNLALLQPEAATIRRPHGWWARRQPGQVKAQSALQQLKPHRRALTPLISGRTVLARIEGDGKTSITFRQRMDVAPARPISLLEKEGHRGLAFGAGIRRA